MDVTVSYVQGVQLSAQSRQHTLLSDQPLDNGGTDQGMTPPEWFLAALGACVGFYAVKFLQTRNLDPSTLTIRITADKASQPTRLDPIQIQLSLGIPLDPQQEAGLKRAVDACIIHNTLTHPPTLTTEILLPSGV
jgi:uncharacterized OsmC-like protein